MPVKVIIYDDNPSRRDSLGLLIGSDHRLELLGAMADCSNVVEEVRHLMPDVILMDIQMPGIDGIEAVRMIHQEFPAVKVIMQTVFEDDEKIFNSLKNGASGYILKKAAPEKVIEAIRDVYEGGAPITPAVAGKVLQFFINLQVPAVPIADEFALSAREIEILAYLSEGLSYKMIADRCHISVHTVAAHIRKIYEKLQVNSATEAIAKAGRYNALNRR